MYIYTHICTYIYKGEGGKAVEDMDLLSDAPLMTAKKLLLGTYIYIYV
jgi:hypothetical protein